MCFALFECYVFAVDAVVVTNVNDKCTNSAINNSLYLCNAFLEGFNLATFNSNNVFAFYNLQSNAFCQCFAVLVENNFVFATWNKTNVSFCKLVNVTTDGCTCQGNTRVISVAKVVCHGKFCNKDAIFVCAYLERYKARYVLALVIKCSFGNNFAIKLELNFTK